MKAPIHAYRRFISPIKPPTCRFYPTCSEYALQAIDKYGPAKGGWLALKRICRCHPFHPGGIDHVPPTVEELARQANDALDSAAADSV
jgi:putative membrane protein insertion efficiency factor